MTEDLEMAERRKAIVSFIKTKWNWILYIVTALIIGWGYKIRTSNLHLLRDVTTGKFIPIALDPHLFLRYARAILEGSLPLIDTMRNVPFYYEPHTERLMASYFSVYFYKIVSLFNSAFTIEQAHVMYPAVAYVLGTIVFFFLVKRLFGVNVATLATLLLTLIPSYLYRTMSGFSDKEALGMFLMFLALYWYVVGLQNPSTKWKVLWGFLAGVATVYMTLTWGGVKFIYLIMGSFVLIKAFFNALEREDFYQYLAYFVAILYLPIFQPGVLSWTTLLTSVTSAIMVVALGVGFVHHCIFHRNIFNLRDKLQGKLPVGLTSFIIAAFIGIGVLLITQGPGFFTAKFSSVYLDLISPFGQDRWQLTVAENHQPFITSWLGQQGGMLFMVMYLAGAVLLFYEMLQPIKDRLLAFKHPVTQYIGWYSIFAILYFLFLFKKSNGFLTISVIVGLCALAYTIYKNGWNLRSSISLFFLSFILFFIFSRYDGGSVLNGTNTVSKLLYVGSLVLVVVVFLVTYLIIYYKDKDLYHAIKKINKNFLFVILWFTILITGARGAARLIFLFSSVITVLAAYVCIRPIEYTFTKKSSLVWKISVPLIVLLVLLSPWSLGTLGDGVIFQFSANTVNQAKYTGPSYNQQWQYAGQWIRDSTPLDSVFIHWWDYGYWVQTGGERATVTDGGNNIGSWNYQIGRHVLTAENTTEALEVFAAHGATHLLIISDEIGKYTAYSSIGSDETYDRFSHISTFGLDSSGSRETRNGSLILFRGGTQLDENLVYNGELFSRGNSGIGGFFLPIEHEVIVEGNTSRRDSKILQPKALFVRNGQQIEIPVGCAYINGEIYQWESELEGCLRVVPSISNGQVNPLGGALWVSRRGVNALWTQLFLFDQKLPGKEHPTLRLAYDDTERMPLAIFNGRLIGPLRIWEIGYPEDFVLSEEKKELYTQYEHENPAAREIGAGFGR